MIRGKALLFGLNYEHIPKAKLNGCINDVKQMSTHIQNMFAKDTFVIEVHTDDIDKQNTSYDGIVRNLYNAAIESYSNNLDFVWVHFSGHGSQAKDTSGDELDYMDEGVCPSDYNTKGIVIDDILNNVMAKFNPRTKVLFVCDSCHSGSILDLRYTWNVNAKRSIIDNNNCKIKSNVILISGCMDNQTSADAYNLLNDNKHIGALTASFINVLEKKPKQLYDVFSFVESLRDELKRGGFSQYPCLSSTYDLTSDTSMIPGSAPAPKLYNQYYFKPIPQRYRDIENNYDQNVSECTQDNVINVPQSVPQSVPQYYQQNVQNVPKPIPQYTYQMPLQQRPQYTQSYQQYNMPVHMPMQMPTSVPNPQYTYQYVQQPVSQYYESQNTYAYKNNLCSGPIYLQFL